MLVLYIVLLLGGIFLLIKGSDIFVDSSVKVAKILKVSEILIGMTLVCFGTSLPELFISINGSIKGTSDLVIGNMVGTNIFNICVILGLISAIHPIRLLKDTVRKDMYMSLVTGVLFLLVTLDTFGTNLTENVISRTDGAILLIMFAIFMYYNLYHYASFTKKTREKRLIKKKIKSGEQVEAPKNKLTKRQKRDLVESILLCIIGGVLVYVGSECVLNGAVGFAKLIGVSETLVAILVIAVGTSLPEIATSITALKKRRTNIAVGNLIGSNMYNMLFVVGLSSVINPLKVVTNTIWIDIMVFILVTIVLILFTKVKYIKKGSYEISRTEGIILVLIYISYATYVVIRG